MTGVEERVTPVGDADLRARLAQRLAQARRAATTTTIPRRPDPSAPVPLSGAQAGMWFAAEYEPDSPAYNVPTGLRLRGRLDRDALVGAVTDLVERHTVLRSVVSPGDDGPVAVQRPATDLRVGYVDLSGEAEPEAALRDRLDREAAQPFALDRDLPVRVTLYRLAEDDHVLALTFHHIAVDAWSLRLVVGDLAANYGVRVGAGGAAPPPALQYADVVAWERERADPARRAAGLDWWRERLAGLPAVLPLPTDRPRPTVVESAGDRVPVDLPADLADGVRRAATATGTTPFMVLLAAWQALLARVSGTDDLAVGMISAGRNHPDTESVVGCFVQTVAVRADLAGEPTGRELLARVRAAVLGALDHADVSLEEVLAAVRPERVAGAHPLFQTLINVYDDPLGGVSLPGLRAEAVDRDTPTAKFDLSLNIADPGPGRPLSGWLGYRTALYDRSTVRDLATWFTTLLRGLVADLDRPVPELPLAPVTGPLLLGPEPSWPDAATTLTALIDQQVRDRPDAPAVVGPDGTLSYAELGRRADLLAGRLRRAGVGPDEPVAVWVERSTDLAVGLLGILRAGGAYLPLDPVTRAPASGRWWPARAAGWSSPSPTWRPGSPTTTRSGTPPETSRPRYRWSSPPACPVGPDPETAVGDTAVPDDPDRLAYVIFTSGSTGTPKGVAVPHRSIVHYLRAVLDRLGPAASGGASFALVSTAAADLGLTCVLGALVTGGTLHVVDRETSLDPTALADYLARHRVDVLKLVPSQLRLLASHGDLAGVLPRRLLVLAGEACPWDLVRRVRDARPDLAVQSHYGPTETTVAVLACDVDEVPEEQRVGHLPLGRPLAGARLHVVDRAGRPAARRGPRRAGHRRPGGLPGLPGPPGGDRRGLRPRPRGRHRTLLPDRRPGPDPRRRHGGLPRPDRRPGEDPGLPGGAG